MQRILLSLCTGTLLLFAQSKAQAQEQAPSSFKRNLIGGSISFGYSSMYAAYYPPGVKATSTTISFTPTYAYYLKEHVAVGATLSYYHYKQKNTSNIDESKGNVYYFGPFIRFEIPLWQSRFSIYNDLGVSGSYSKTTSEDGGYKSSYDSWGAAAWYEPGIMFRIKSNVALQASVGQLLTYAYTKNDEGYAHSFGIRSNHNGTDDFRIGINFLF